jgi:hypothetical protein
MEVKTEHIYFINRIFIRSLYTHVFFPPSTGKRSLKTGEEVRHNLAEAAALEEGGRIPAEAAASEVGHHIPAAASEVERHTPAAASWAAVA